MNISISINSFFLFLNFIIINIIIKGGAAGIGSCISASCLLIASFRRLRSCGDAGVSRGGAGSDSDEAAVEKDAACGSVGGCSDFGSFHCGSGEAGGATLLARDGAEPE